MNVSAYLRHSALETASTESPEQSVTNPLSNFELADYLCTAFAVLLVMGKIHTQGEDDTVDQLHAILMNLMGHQL